MDDVYGQHIHLHLLTICINVAISHHYLQLCYHPLQNAKWQLYIYNPYHLFWMVLDHVTWHNKKNPCGILIEFWPK